MTPALTPSLPCQVQRCPERESESEPEGNLGKCPVSVESLGLDNRFREGLRPSPLHWVGPGCSGAGKSGRPKVRGPVQNGERDSSPHSGPFFQDLGTKKELRARPVADIQGTDGDTEARHGESGQRALGGHSRVRVARGAWTPHLVLIPRHQALEEVTSG